MPDRPVYDADRKRWDAASDLICSNCGSAATARHQPGCRALLSPVHVDELPTRAGQLRNAREWTKGERPIVVHRGSFGDLEHVATNDLAESMNCPCGPDLTR